MMQDQILEQVAAVIREADAIVECHPSKDARGFANSAAIIMKTQKERIAELEALNDELFNKLNFERGHRAQLEKDATRYRWLRSNLGTTVSHWLCAEGGEQLDNEIDFWMAKSNADN